MKSSSLTFSPECDGKVKSGALSPALSMRHSFSGPAPLVPDDLRPQRDRRSSYASSRVQPRPPFTAPSPFRESMNASSSCQALRSRLSALEQCLLCSGPRAGFDLLSWFRDFIVSPVLSSKPLARAAGWLARAWPSSPGLQTSPRWPSCLSGTAPPAWGWRP